MTGSQALTCKSANAHSDHQAEPINYWGILPILCFCLLAAGCSIGPDFEKPQAPVLNDWTDDNPVIVRNSIDLREWWTVFEDPVLNELIEESFKQNLSLQLVGLRILEARARLGIAEGNLYPQQQQIGGSVSTNQTSENSPNFNSSLDSNFTNYQFGFDATWEIDFWGRLQRGVEAADAGVNASFAEYDDALVSLAAEVARSYVTIRTLQTQLKLARANIGLQQESLRIAQVRFDNGATSNLDVQQALSNLASTQASVPSLTASLHQARNALSILLGKPPGELKLYTSASTTIPKAPALVAVGIPSELLRRRPDVRRAEFDAASQSALIGVAEGELYPTFSLFGSIGYQTSDTGSSTAGDLLDSDSLFYSAGPQFSWNIFNYGQIRNNVRVQDARYQQTLVNYQNTVLRAYQETEDAMIGFVQAQAESGFREQSATAAQRATELANIQYREGAADFQRVIDSERSLVSQQNLWTSARGSIALNLIALYKALGGGWDLRDAATGPTDYVNNATRETMTQRTNWGDILEPPAVDAQQ
jgi:NodT family efflux transporter outer membrane factor (OMF) lipoprotein